MKIVEHLIEGIKLAALFGTVALVVWSMPEYPPAQAQGKPEPSINVNR